MRKHDLISLIYANLEKTSAAAEEAAQTNASPVTPMRGCRCDRWGDPLRSLSRSTAQTRAELLSFTRKIER